MRQSLAKITIRGFQLLLNSDMRPIAVKDWSVARPWLVKSDLSGCDGWMVIARLTPNHCDKIVGSSPAKTSWLIKNRPAWATGDDKGASVHSAVNEYMRWQLYLDYPWRLEACKWVYIPQGVEQVMDITGLPRGNNM